MDDQFGLYVAATLAVLLTIGAYWLAPGRRSAIAASPISLAGLFGLVAAGIGFNLWSVSQERADPTFEQQSNPLAIAVAFDLSPSMLAIPHPDTHEPYPPRFERGKDVLLDLLGDLEARGEPVIVAVVGFTKRANVIMGWDESTTQVRDILGHAVAPELFGSAGTSIESAANALDDVYAMLPAELRASDRKLAIVVSDGEDTMRASSFEYAMETFREADFSVIALQTGFTDRNEGIPVYDAIGEFTQFRPVRGEIYTRPDFAAMSAVAEVSPRRGVHVRAESADAVQQMLDFAIGVESGRAPDPAWISTLGLFVVVSLLCAFLLR